MQRGELVASCSAPYSVGRFGVTNLPSGELRQVVAVLSFLRDNPREYLARMGK
jgi:hypothetical protein